MAEWTSECKKVDKIIKGHSYEKSALIIILQEIENLYGYLPAWAMKHVSEERNVPLIQVYGVASFYDVFHLTPRGKHLIRVCTGTACYLRGSPRVLETVTRELGIKDGETTSDQKFSLQSVHCVGACAQAPVMLVGNHYFGKIKPTKVRSVLKAGAGENERG